jgi:hypothetical protein
MPLPGSHRDKAQKKALQEIVNEDQVEFLQEVNEPQYEEEQVEEPAVEEEKPTKRKKKFGLF